MVLLREHASMAGFMALYAVVYLLAAAFYNPISATGTTRYLICHLTPLFFVIACFRARAVPEWRLGRSYTAARRPRRSATLA